MLLDAHKKNVSLDWWTDAYLFEVAQNILNEWWQLAFYALRFVSVWLTK